MTTTQLPSEEELEVVLRDEPKFFMQALYEFYSEKVMAYLGKVSWDLLSAEELEDAFQESMIGVWHAIRAEGFDPKRPLRMVFRIVRNKGVDFRRRKLRRSAETNRDEVIDLIVGDLCGSKLAADWECISEEEKRRFNDALPRIIAALPKRQKAAVSALLECYTEIRAKDTYRPVAEAMSQITGKWETVAAAKSALRAGLEKVREELKRQGFDFVEGRLV